MLTIDDIREEVRRLDDNLGPEDDAFKAAVVLLASAIVGPNQKTVGDFTGYDHGYMREIGRRLRKNGIWVRRGRYGSALHHSGWFDEEAGGDAFWLDVSCALGCLDRHNE